MRKIILIALASLFLANHANAKLNLDNEISKIRFDVTNIAHSDLDKEKAYNDILAKTNLLLKQLPDNDELKVWKATILSSQAKFLGLSALSNVKQAKKLLENAIKNDRLKEDPTAYYMLGILYYKAPVWPVAFGNDKKAKNYFMQALKISDNIDTNYRYGEFLIDQGKKDEALIYLRKAVSFENRENRKEDELKKLDIRKLIFEIK